MVTPLFGKKLHHCQQEYHSFPESPRSTNKMTSEPISMGRPSHVLAINQNIHFVVAPMDTFGGVDYDGPNSHWDGTVDPAETSFEIHCHRVAQHGTTMQCKLCNA